MSFIHSLYLCKFIKATMCLHYFKRERKVVTEYPLMPKTPCLWNDTLGKPMSSAVWTKQNRFGLKQTFSEFRYTINEAVENIYTTGREDSNQKTILETLSDPLRDTFCIWPFKKNVSNTESAFLDLWISIFCLGKIVVNIFYVQADSFRTVTSDFSHGASFMWHLWFLSKAGIDMTKSAILCPLWRLTSEWFFYPRNQILCHGRLLCHPSYLKSCI